MMVDERTAKNRLFYEPMKSQPTDAWRVEQIDTARLSSRCRQQPDARQIIQHA